MTIKKKFFSRTNRPISTTLGTKDALVKRFQVYSNKGQVPFPKGDDNEIAKIYRYNFKIFFSRINRLILTNLDTKYPSEKDIKVCSNEGPYLFQGAIMCMCLIVLIPFVTLYPLDFSYS